MPNPFITGSGDLLSHRQIMAWLREELGRFPQRAIVISPTGQISDLAFQDGMLDLNQITDVVGGSFEVIRLGEGRMMLINDSGMSNRLPINGTGSVFYNIITGFQGSHTVCGDVVICNETDLDLDTAFYRKPHPHPVEMPVGKLGVSVFDEQGQLDRATYLADGQLWQVAGYLDRPSVVMVNVATGKQRTFVLGSPLDEQHVRIPTEKDVVKNEG